MFIYALRSRRSGGLQERSGCPGSANNGYMPDLSPSSQKALLDAFDARKFGQPGQVVPPSPPSEEEDKQMDQAQPDSLRDRCKERPYAILGVLLVWALGCFVMQLIAVSAHWATVSVSIAELESRGEIPLDKIPDEDYHEDRLE